MIKTESIQTIIRVAGLVTGLVVLQQLVARSLFGLAFDWPAVPQFALVNFGIVAGWYYFKSQGKKLPVFVVVIAAFFLAIWLRAVLVYLGVFRFVAPLIVAFIERQLAYIMAIISMQQFIPAVFAALILLLLLPKAGAAWRRLISNGRF